MNTDKAYLLGLVIGGGVFGTSDSSFLIRLPYRKWGSYLENPSRAGEISQDIMRRVGQMFRAVYGLSVSCDSSRTDSWTIVCNGDLSLLKADLHAYGIKGEGELRGNADIGRLTADLVDDNLKRRFIAGLADTIGSMAKSHRRFTDEHQIISFEIKGYNFAFVCDLCRLLYGINCISDQINWNHPNIHCPSNPYYTQWNKGFKLRVLLDQYAAFGAFAFRTKVASLNENRKLQKGRHEAVKCEKSELRPTVSAVHKAENDPRLPETIRGGHYIHYHHFCAVLGCEHAPYEEIEKCLNRMGDLITPFPILCKGDLPTINGIIDTEPLLAKRTYTTTVTSVASLATMFDRNKHALLHGETSDSGYPVKEILKGVAYIIANDSELAGSRPKGGYADIVHRHLAENPSLTVEIRRPEILTPLVIAGNGRAALVGARNPAVYGKLVSRDTDNRYKTRVRPIIEEDLKK